MSEKAPKQVWIRQGVERAGEWNCQPLNTSDIEYIRADLLEQARQEISECDKCDLCEDHHLARKESADTPSD